MVSMSVDKNNEGMPSSPYTPDDKGSLLRFGAFTLEMNRHGLFLGSERIHLTSKPFETLTVLVETFRQHGSKATSPGCRLEGLIRDGGLPCKGYSRNPPLAR